VADTEVGRDPEAPVTHSSIAELLRQERPGLKVVQCSLETVRAGAAAVQACLNRGGLIIADAETDHDLSIIAEAALSHSPLPTMVGSAGLAAALAPRLFGELSRPQWPAERGGPALAVLASSSRRLIEQAAYAVAEPDIAVVPFPCEGLTWEEEPVPELATAIEHGAGMLAAGRNTLIYAAGGLPEAERPVDLIVEHLAHLAYVVVKQAAPRGLLVGGGATAQAVLGALTARLIEVDDEPLPGIAAGMVVGGDFAGLPVVLKPGAAGEKDTVAELLQYLGRRVAAREEAR
jgi:uncharacterized protein YgbK (DUF1537 family)